MAKIVGVYIVLHTPSFVEDAGMGTPPRSRPNIAKLLDKVTALPSVRRA